MFYVMANDILAFKRLQCFNAYIMCVFMFNLSGDELGLATAAVKAYILEPLYAAKHVRSAMQLIQTFLCSESENGFAIDYDQIHIQTLK